MEFIKNSGLWDVFCPEKSVTNQPCTFVSRGWATKTLAEKRMKEHIEEHDTGIPMQEIAAFERAN